MTNVINFAQKALIENKKGDVLILKNPDNAKHNPKMLHFPGGRINFGEDLDDHIIRKIFEETTIKIKPLEPLALVSWIITDGETERKEFDGMNLHIVAVVRYCKYISGKPTHIENVDDEEIESVFWINPKKLLKHQDFDKKQLPALKAYLKKKDI